MSVLDWFKKREPVRDDIFVEAKYMEVVNAAGQVVDTTRSIDDVGAPVPTSHNRIVLYADDPRLRFGPTIMTTVGWYSPPTPIACDTCDVVDVSTIDDTYRRFRCVHCGRESVTSEPNAAIGKTTRLFVMTCAACGTVTPADGAYCIGCGAGRLR